MADLTPQIFSITAAQADFAGILAFACTIPGTIMCFLVLVAFGTVASFPKARPHLDRVSFRLLVYTLIFNVLFGIAFSVTSSLVAPGPICNVGAFSVNLTLNFSTFFTSCIALNLQLVLVHGLNGKKMEKYYVIGTTILSLALTVPAYGLDQFGWDAQNSTCWFKNPNDALRLRWLIGTQSFWIGLAATIETTCSIIVLTWMFRFQMVTHHLKKAFQPGSYGRSTTKVGTSSHWSGTSGRSSVLAQANKYRNVILRIALYPIVSLMMNIPTVALDLNQTIKGVHTQLDFRLLVLDLVLYGVRTAAYATLAFSDPSFVNGIREIRGGSSKWSKNTGETMSKPNFAPGRRVDTSVMSTTQGQMTVNVELEQVSHTDDLSSYDKNTKMGNAYVERGREEDGLTVNFVGLAARADERKAGADIESEQDRKFQRQL